MQPRYGLGLGALLLLGLLGLSVPEAGSQSADTRPLAGERGPRLRGEGDPGRGQGRAAPLLLGRLGLSGPEAGSQSADTRPLAGERGPRLRVEVDLVLVQVTVTDPYNRLVTGVDKEHFEVSQDRAAQRLWNHPNEDESLALGLVFDVSGSMESSGKMERATK